MSGRQNSRGALGGATPAGDGREAWDEAKGGGWRRDDGKY